jgi:hypothetical protein
MLPAMGNAREIAGFSQLPHDLWQRHAVCGGSNFPEFRENSLDRCGHIAV